MKINAKYIKAIVYPASFAILGYSAYANIKDSKNYKSVDDLKKEIAQKDPKRYDSLMSDGVSRYSYKEWLHEAQKVNDSLKTESKIRRAYFEGAQMVRDSIKNAERTE